MLEAIDHVKDFGLGDARPQLYRCRDVMTEEEANWSLKFMGRNDHELAADWIGALLAHRLEIRTPAVDIAEASQEAIDTSRALAEWALCGPALASREIAPADTIKSIPRLLEVARPAEMAKLFAFDAWFDLIDRQRPDGVWNLLMSLDDAQDLWVIDYGKGLSSHWVPFLGAPVSPLEPLYPAEVMSVIQAGEAPTSCQDACRMIADIPEAHLYDIVNSTPPQWLEPVHRAGVVRFLLERTERLPGLC